MSGQDAQSQLPADDYHLTPPVAIEPLRQAGVNNTVWLVRTGAGEFVWKRMHAGVQPATLAYEHRLLGELARQAPPFALPLPVRARDGASVRQLPDGRLGVLLPRLPGEQVARHDPAAIEALGEAGGALVTALAGVEPRPHPIHHSFGNLGQIHPRLPAPLALRPTDLGVAETPEHSALCDWWRSFMAKMAAFVAGPYQALPRQMTHGDFGPMNALAVAGRVTAVLDFEFAQPDARAIDVAAPLVFVMRLWERELAAALARGAAYCRGFARTGSLTAAEIAVLPELMLLRDVVGTIWWLGRDLAERGRATLERMAELRAFAELMERHGDEVREVVGTALG